MNWEQLMPAACCFCQNAPIFVRMNAALLRFLHLFMAVVVLLSSMGFGLVEHSCQLRGKRVYSVYNAQPGCQLCKTRPATESRTPAVKHTDCCKDDARYSNVETASSLSQLLAKFVKTIAEPLGAAVALLVAFVDGLHGRATSVAVAHYASPPPLAGRALLAFVQTYLL